MVKYDVFSQRAAQADSGGWLSGYIDVTDYEFNGLVSYIRHFMKLPSS